jgi:hypothetical protein
MTYLVRPDGTRLHRMRQRANADNWGGYWSPTGNSFVYVSAWLQEAEPYDLYVHHFGTGAHGAPHSEQRIRRLAGLAATLQYHRHFRGGHDHGHRRERTDLRRRGQRHDHRRRRRGRHLPAAAATASSAARRRTC